MLWWYLSSRALHNIAKSTLQRPSVYVGVAVYVISWWNSVYDGCYDVSVRSSKADAMVVSYF